MLLLPVTPSHHGASSADDATPQANTAAWLAGLLATACEPESTSPGINERLKTISLEAIIAAIEQGRPGVTGAAEILLYRRWIEANTGTSPHLFAAWFNLGAALGLTGDKAGALIAYGQARSLRPDFPRLSSIWASGSRQPARSIWPWPPGLQPSRPTRPARPCLIIKPV